MAKKIGDRKYKTLKRLLDEVFSQFIRQRDTGPNGFGSCISCGQTTHYSQGDAGHYITRGRLSTRWDERNVNFQCRACNRFPDMSIGRKYAKNLDIKYGAGMAEKLESDSKFPVKFKTFELQDKLEYYKSNLH